MIKVVKYLLSVVKIFFYLYKQAKFAFIYKQ